MKSLVRSSFTISPAPLTVLPRSWPAEGPFFIFSGVARKVHYTQQNCHPTLMLPRPRPDVVPELTDGFINLSLRSLRVRLQQAQPKELETTLRGLKLPVLQALSSFMGQSLFSQFKKTDKGKKKVNKFGCCSIKRLGEARNCLCPTFP